MNLMVKKALINGTVSGVIFVLLVALKVSDFVYAGISTVLAPNYVAVFALGFALGAISIPITKYISTQGHL